MIKIVSTVLVTSALAFANPFGSGTKSIGITLGTGSVSYSSGTFYGSYTENYYILGLNADYFVAENLSLGVGYRGWFGGSPTINQASIPVTYYIPTQSKFRPYLGAFYRYTAFNDDQYENYSSAGGRAGLAILFTNGYAGFGWVQEYYLNADSTSDSTSGYPEAVVGFSF